MQRKTTKFSFEDKFPMIDNILFSPYPVAYKKEAINDIVTFMRDAYNSKATYIWNKINKNGVQEKILQHYAADAVRDVLQKRVNKLILEDADVCILNAYIREAILKDANIKFLCELFKVKPSSLFDKNLLKSAEQVQMELDENAKEMEKYMYDVNEAISGMGFS